MKSNRSKVTKLLVNSDERNFWLLFVETILAKSLHFSFIAMKISKSLQWMQWNYKRKKIDNFDSFKDEIKHLILDFKCLLLQANSRGNFKCNLFYPLHFQNIYFWKSSHKLLDHKLKTIFQV